MVSWTGCRGASTLGPGTSGQNLKICERFPLAGGRKLCGWQMANSAGRQALETAPVGAPFYVQLDGVGPATYTTLTRPRFRVVPPQRIFSPSEVAIDMIYPPCLSLGPGILSKQSRKGEKDSPAGEAEVSSAGIGRRPCY